MNTFTLMRRFNTVALLILALLLILAIGVRAEAQDEPTIEPTSVPIVVTVTASETPSDEGSVLITGDWLSVLQVAGTLFFGAAALYAIHRTGKVSESLGGFIDRLSSNATLVTSLEQKFNRLKPDEQARLTRIIDILDPWTKTTANPEDDKAIVLLREISDGIPASEKPPTASTAKKMIDATHYPPGYFAVRDKPFNDEPQG